MALQQYKDPNSQTYFGYDSTNNQAIAFSDPTNFNKYFSSFDANAPAPTFDTSTLLASPNQILSIGQTPQVTTQPAPAPMPVSAPSQPIPTTTVAPATPNQTLAQETAQAGLSADDYLKLVSPTVSPEEKQAIYDKLGITQLEQQTYSPPSKTTQQLYQDAYSQAALGDLKTKIQSLLDQINKSRSDLTDATGVINENPFLSEASRVGRVNRLSDKAQAQIGNLTNQLSQLQDLYNNGVNEVNSLVSRSSADFQQNQSLNQQHLEYLLQKAEGQIGDLQTSKTQQGYTYLPDYLKAKATATQPNLVGSGDTGYYAWDPTTGTFVQKIQPTTSTSTNPIEYAVKNNITQPFYQVGNQIINTATGKPEYTVINVNGNPTYQRISDGKEYSSPDQFFSDAGITSWSQIQTDVGTTDKLLSPTEAARLGVPYGTTQQQAAALSVTPTLYKTSTKTSPTTVSLTNGTNLADQYLSSRRGSDGYVSPEDWQTARDAWIQDGLDVNTFYTRFKKYINPADPQDY